VNAQRSTPRCVWLVVLACFCAVVARADVSVTASVDRNRVAFGESLTFTITVEGTQNGAQPSIPAVDGLNFNGPSTQTSVSIVNGAMSQSLSLVYQVTPARPGEFTIPAIPVGVGDRTYQTKPIKLTVTQGQVQEDLRQSLFAKVQLNSQQVYLGETVPLNVVLFARANVPLKNVGGFTSDADGLGYKFLQNLKSGANTINGETFNIYMIEGAISPTRAGKLAFGPCAVKAQLAVQSRRRSNGSLFDDSIFEQMFGRVEVREVPVTIDPIPIEVLPLPEDGRPADFTGAVGQWNLEVTAKPTQLAVGDPITLTVKISGNGNIDTVATPQLQGLDGFKTYDPTSKTTKDELSTTGERVFQQVLVPKSTEAKQLPQVRLSYFDPVAKAYKTAVQAPIQLVVKAGSGGTAVLATGAPARPTERLGQDIVYLKGDLGPVTTATCSYSTIAFWVLNVLPVFSLLGLVAWKQRVDRLRGDVAYARRSRAAKHARRMLAEAKSFDQVQHALQSYLGDRLNIPASGITVSIVDEQLEPRGLDGDLAAALKRCFEVCDNARFAGDGNNETEMRATANKVGELIDALEKIHL